jgi:hypothetical protein
MSFFDDMFSAASEWFGGDGASSVESVSSSILDGAQLVGSILAVAGAITGDPKLMKIGAGVSIGATAISAFSKLPSFSAEAESKVVDEMSVGPQAPELNAPTGLMGTDGMQAVGGLPQSGGIIGPSMSGPIAPKVNDAQPVSNMATQAQMPGPQAPRVSSEAPLSAGSASDAESIRLKTSDLGASTSIAKDAARKLNPAGQGLIGGMLGFARENPEILKLGTGLISGAVQGYQQDSLRRDNQRRYDDELRRQDEQRARYNRSILDQNIGRP